MNLKNKAALITGAAKSMGVELSAFFVNDGGVLTRQDYVSTMAYRSPAVVATWDAEIEASGVNIIVKAKAEANVRSRAVILKTVLQI